MLRFTFEADGIVLLDRALGRYGKALKNFKPAFEDIAVSFRRIEAEQFNSRGQFSWASLSPSYEAWKQENFPGKPLLELSGTLRESLAGQGPGHVEDVTEDSLTIGTNVYYAIFHQRGTSRMPARPVIKLTEANKTEWMKILQRHAYEAAREAGLV